MSDYLLSIDLGTSSCKAALFDLNLKPICFATAAYDTLFPKTGWAEQPASQWWEALCKNCKTIIAKSGISAKQIIGVGIDSMSSAVLPVDENGEALRPGLIWMDRRATKQQEWLDKEFGDELFKINGNHNDPSNFGPKVLWVKEEEPEIYKQTRYFLHANGYLVYKLTGVPSTDISEGGMSQLFDTRKGEWSQRLINGFGLDADKIPPIFNCTDIVGKVTAKVADECGLAEGTPVVAGAMDNVAAGMGAGVHKAGQVYVSGGTVTTSGVCIDKPLYNEKLHLYHHIVPGHYLSVGGVDFGGAGFKWFKGILEEDDYGKLDSLVSQTSHNANPALFLPYMVGQRPPLYNNNTRGVLFGLNPSTDKANLLRTIMEGTAFGTQKVLQIVEENGASVEQIRMTGGSSRSKPWTQIFADITGKNIDIPGSDDVATLGSAIAAGIGVGAIPSFYDAVSRIPVSNTYEPDTKKTAYYETMQQLFENLYDSIESCYDDLANIRQNFS
ncbi:MAG: hypothetical protein HQL32_02715 [Planctomycetes bacterium]|nr:hypothetical protein [Planctomycetota bacterium]